MSAVTERLSVLFPQNGLPLVETQINQLDRYAALLKEWNEKMNLTAITDDEGICVKHFLDCALALRCVESAGANLAGGRVIDVGTGAGFPGVVWKILRPDMELTLLDSLQKRLTFLNAVCEELGLQAELVHLRAEEGGRDARYRLQFDAAAARAVAGLNVLCEYCLPFVKKGGVFAAMKGPQLKEELPQAEGAIRKLGGTVRGVPQYDLPGEGERAVALIARTGELKPLYPRHGGKIRKEPLA